MVTRIAVIPARGGSKRLPRKNLVEFFGKPMLVWTIEAALETRLFDRVLVSTEDAAIAEIARRHGASVPFLRDRHFDDFSTVSDVTLTALRQSAELLGETYDLVMQLMPNCPLRDTADIRAALAQFETGGADFQISCVRFGWMNPRWAFERAEGRGRPLFPEAAQRRSQDLPPLYCPTGAIWIAHVDALRRSGTFYGPGQRFEPLSWISAVDIDDEDDLAFARAAYLVKHGRAG